MIAGTSVVERLREARTEPSLVLLAADGSENTVYHDQLLGRAEAWRHGLTQTGAKPGDAVIIILEHGVDLYAAFIGAILGGMIPSIFAHPSDKYAEQHYFNNVGLWMDSATAKVLITYAELAERLKEKQVLGERKVLTEPVNSIRDEVKASQNEAAFFGSRHEAGPNSPSIIFQQFTSGTTGLKKGVQISEAQLLWQVDHYGSMIGLQDGDRIASWLPLYHDMGLITCCLLPLLTGIPVVAISPFEWVRRPALLLDAVHRHQCTLSWMPNFAFSFMADRIAEAELQDIDLSSWRGLVNCAEPLQVDSVFAFRNRFEKYGFNPSALASSYAMAEATFAVTSGGFGVPPMVDQVDVQGLESRQMAEVAGNGRLLLSSGRVLPGSSVRIIDHNGQLLSDRQVGEIVIESPSLVSGYSGVNSEKFHDNKFYSGDTGYRVGDQLFVIGRIKDTIIIAGRNLYPQDVEAVVESVPGIVAGRSVAFGINEPTLGTQKLVVMAESKISDDIQRQTMAAKIRQCIAAQLDSVASDVRIVDSMSLIKSTSGKISRGANREHYLKQKTDTEAVPNMVSERSTLKQLSSSDELRVLLRRCVEEVIREACNGAMIAFDDRTALVGEGLLDSFAFVSLIATIERNLHCIVPNKIKQNSEGHDSIESLSQGLIGFKSLNGAARENTRVQGAAATRKDSRLNASNLVPQMADVAAQGYEWTPYLMRQGKGNFGSNTLNSDEHGFRRGLDNDGILSYQKWSTGAWQHGVIMGNSVAYGVGTSEDASIIGNRLNAQETGLQRRWYTLALRASNMTQERLALEMYAPLDKQWVVWISGINELIALIVGEGVPGRPSPFVGERAWRQAINPTAKINQRSDSWTQRYESALNSVERDLFLVSHQCRAVGAKFVFVLQPAMSWIEKKLTPEEKNLVAVFDKAASPLQRAHNPEQLGEFKTRYRHDLRGICERNAIEFIDANEDDDFTRHEWLFIDRTHLTDLGHQCLEAMVLEWLGGERMRCFR